MGGGKVILVVVDNIYINNIEINVGEINFMKFIKKRKFKKKVKILVEEDI